MRETLETQPRLLRVIGRWSLVALVLNAMIGSSTFGLPSVIAGFLGARSVLAYLLAAVCIGVIMACFAEVASQFPDSGGSYIYARAAFGRFVGIEMGWLTWLVRLSAAAANANLFVVYMAQLVPQAKDPTLRVLTLSLLISVLAAVNYRDVTGGVKLNNAFALAKLVPLLGFTTIGLFFAHSHSSPSRTPNLTPGNWLDAILLLIYAYGGFEAALMPMGEVENPQRDAPFALFTGLAVCTVIYTVIQAVVMRTLINPAATDSPLALAAREMIGPLGSIIMALAALLCLYGYLSGQMLNVPRLTYALAEQGDFPSFFGCVHPRFRTPYISVLVFAISVWGLAVVGSFQWNLTLSAIARLFTYAIVCAALPVLRRKNPHNAAFRLSGGSALATVGMVICLILATRIGLNELLILIAATVVALLNWSWMRRTKGRTPAAV